MDESVITIGLRPTTADDLEFVLALEHHPDNHAFIGQWPRERHLEAIARADREHWIIERAEDAARLGYLIAYDVIAGGYGMYIKRIAVADPSRGVGRAALRAFAAHAFDVRHAASVCLAVRDYNDRARRAYRAVGFDDLTLAPAQRSQFNAIVDQVGDDCLVLRLTPERLLR